MPHKVLTEVPSPFRVLSLTLNTTTEVVYAAAAAMGTWNHIVFVRRRLRVAVVDIVDIVVIVVIVVIVDFVEHQHLNDTFANQVGVGLLLDEREVACGRTRR